MKKRIFSILVAIAVVVVVVVAVSGKNSLIEGRQLGSMINLDYATPVELVIRHEGRFVEVESGMVYSLPGLWRSDIESLEGKKNQILGTRYLYLPGSSWCINGEKIIGRDVTHKGTAIRMVTEYGTYTYTGTVLAVYGDTCSNVYRIYWPHRFPKK
jgi:hypothetical protein